ncbi:ATP-binding cassette domain-containing protein [Nonomuraea phyllanthi]|uniref:ABC-type quaternary amine transporter n=1 Tax=Nonomuraea phyllanthi TaxID=2219224 RepID=A0A5C4WKB8_9ACTN|nr:ABC transporter ATP-binding protein [Nonomuraea phyllanthi]KAB8194282.1 ATP-binding cassette domain-containing protein [Nonomuraea phyllanthi]
MIELKSLCKSFDGVPAVRDLDLVVGRGEFLCLLGSSGCGKSTTLRMIAGFVQPDSGTVLIDGIDVSGFGPDARPTSMVFQDYAIFPHLTVAENIEFGLKAQKLARDERARRTEEALELVGLTGLGGRRPNELSGGQQQRVAVARSLAIRPSVLLMDEPLSNLDAKTRIQLRTQLREIQRDTGTTIVYVTHDQEEALALGDRIAVMRDGSLEQLGSGHEIYLAPSNGYVADFVGITNWLVGEFAGESPESWEVIVAGAALPATPASASPPVSRGSLVDVSVRPEDVSLTEEDATDGRALRGVVRDVQFLGPVVRTYVDVEGSVVIVHSAQSGWSPGTTVRLAIGNGTARAFPRTEGAWRPPGAAARPESAVAAAAS